MGWNDDRLAVLKRIVAMLFLLAGLADLAAMANRRTRRRVLETLYQAEILARRFVAGVILDHAAAPMQIGPPEPVFLPCGGDPADAADLGQRLRAFAFVLAHLVMLAELFKRNAACEQDDTCAAMQAAAGDIMVRCWAGLNPLALALRVAAIRAPPPAKAL